MRTGIRSNSIAAARDHVDRRDELGGLGVEDDEQQQRVPERDLQARPVGAQQRDRDEMEVDQEADRAGVPPVTYIAEASATPSTSSISPITM